MNRLQTLLEWLEKSPDDVFLHFGVAMEYLSVNNSVEAIRKMEYILNHFPDYLPNYYQLGKQYELQNNNERAIEIFELGISLATQQKETKTAGELRSALEELSF